MSRRLIRAALRQFFLIYLGIVLIGGLFFYFALSSPQPSNRSFAYSNAAASSLWIQYLFLLGSQTLYVVPVATVKTKLRMTKRTATLLSAYPVVFIVAYGLFLSYFINRSGRVDLASSRGILIGLIPFGAGLVPLIGVLAVARSALRKMSKRRSAPKTSWTTSEWARSRRARGDDPFATNTVPPEAAGGSAPPELTATQESSPLRSGAGDEFEEVPAATQSPEQILEPRWAPEPVRASGEIAPSGDPANVPGQQAVPPRHSDGTW